jgi:ribonuclease Z
MGNMRRIAVWLLGLALALGALVAIGMRIPAVQDRVLRALIPRLVASAPNELFSDDALRVLLCGTGSPLPHATRAKACVAVFAGGRFWVVDTGPGSWNRLALLRIDAARIGGVLLTHFHSDHIGDLGELDLNTWVAGRSGPLRVFGPPGVERVVAGFEEAFALDAGYRVAHHGAELLDPAIGRMQAVPVPGPAQGTGPTRFVDESGLAITAFAVRHDPVTPAYGYRFEYGGRSVVVSGDTAADPAVASAANGADVLVHEAQANHIVALIGEAAAAASRPRVAKVMADIPSYHTSPVEAARLANDAGVKLLVLYHLNPPPPTRMIESVFTRGVSEVRPAGWLLADDGLLLELPTGTSEVRTRQLD